MEIRKFVLIAIITIVLVGCSTSSSTMKISPNKLDFGTVNLGSTKDLDLEIRNKLGKPVDITRIEILDSNDFVIISNNTLPVYLMANEILTVSIRFTPTVDGEENGLFLLEYGPSMKLKQVNIFGTGRPVPIIGISHNSHDFSTRLINVVHTHDFSIENTGTKILSISNLAFTGTGASAYKIAGGISYLTIAQGASETITIEFEPAVVGVFTAELEIVHDAENESNPLTFTVQGEGVIINPQITINQTNPWDFGTIPVSYSAIQTLELENTGTDAMDITSIAVQTGVEFIIDSICNSGGSPIATPINLGVSDKILIDVKFSPTAKITYTDKITIVHNATNKPHPFEIDLTGIGRDLISKTFTYTGAKDTLQLPAGVTTIHVEIYGAQGGDAYPPAAGNDPGKGGKVTATLQVPPGSLLEINVGGKGSDASGTAGGPGGWNSGGKGGTFTAMQMHGGGGGGASDVRVNGSALTDRIVVAGSGGGGGGILNGNFGGNGGGLIGKDGMLIGAPDPQYCGGGGTQSSGGSAGNGGGTCSPGALGIGGDCSGVDTLGGGGGSGYYGGGAGSYGGGGGGSSYTDNSASNVVHDQGVRSGDGEIKISY